MKKIIKFFNYFEEIFFTSSMASKGPFAGGGITSGILLTISGLMKVWFSGRAYLAVLATP